jgi:hypothetical protein
MKRGRNDAVLKKSKKLHEEEKTSICQTWFKYILWKTGNVSLSKNNMTQENIIKAI